MGLLTDIYNTVARFFRAQEGQVEGDPSKSVAQNRLKLVLMQDRTNLTPKVLEQMRGEMIDLLSKYLEMDKDLLELNFEQEGDQVALMLSIPVIRAKDEEEIEEAIKAQQEAKENESSDENEDEENSEENSENDFQEEASSNEEQAEEAPKPNRRRSKKVTPPEGMNEEVAENNSENQEGDQGNLEHHEEVVCEHQEG